MRRVSASCQTALAIFLMLAILISNQASADLEIKGIKIGMSKDELNAAHPGVNCGTANECKQLNAKTLKTLANFPVKKWSFYFSDDGKLKRSTVTVASSGDGELKTALIEKFGKPTRVNTSEYNMRGGRPSVTRTETVWIEGDTHLSVKYPAELDFTEASVELYSKTLSDVEAEASKAKRRKDL